MGMPRRRRRRGRRRRHRRDRRGEEDRAGLRLGGRGDKSFNDSAAAGLDAAKQKLGDQIEVKDLTPNKDGSNRKEILDSLVGDGYQLLFGIGFAFTPDIVASAKENTDVQFAGVDVFDTLCTEKKNLTCLGFKEHEGSFIVGAAAALKSKSNTVGFVGGQEVELIKKFQAGYEAGVKYINETEGKTSRSWSTTPATPSRPSPTRPRARSWPSSRSARTPTCSTTPPARPGNGVIAEAAAKQKYAIERLRPEPDRQPGRAEVDPDLDAQAGRHRRAGHHREVRGRPADRGQRPVVRGQGGWRRLRPERVQPGAARRLPPKLDEIKEKIASGEIKVPDKPAN